MIHHEKPNYSEVNSMDLQNNSAENFYIMHYLKRREFTNSKKELLQKHTTLAQLFEENQKKHQNTNMENFYTEKRPKSLQEARVTNQLPKNIEGHIIVCGLIKGIKNLILPLRCKNLGRNKRPIVILTNDNVNGDTYVWPEINRFQDIYLIKGSALQPAILEKAMAHKARSIIILAKQKENKKNGQERMDAGNIFIYRTIVAQYPQVNIVTELEAMSTLAYLVQDNDEISNDTNFYASKPFASGEIFVGSLLDSLMCQAYYNRSVMDILDQFIMGSANTPANILKIY